MMSGISADVAVRAYQLFLSRGAEHGRDVDDWLEAERQLRSTSVPPPVPRPARRSAPARGVTKKPSPQRAR
jgi:hypothetical protein